MKDSKLRAVRRMEERLKAMDPADAGKLAKKLVKLKDAWLNG